MIDRRDIAQGAFRANLGPLLALGEEHPRAEEVFVDGDRIRLSFGDTKRTFAWGDFPGLAPDAVAAAAQNAAVYAETEFGSVPPASPMISVKMPPDLRVTFTAPPVSAQWHARIRFLRLHRFSLDDYVSAGIMSEEQVEQIRELVAGGRMMIVSGGTMTGKTTLLRAILGELPANTDLCVIEDTPELRLAGDNVAYMQTTRGHDLSDLLRQSLRMSPERIVCGEVRGVEAIELVTAANTGHDGTLCTLHSHGARQALTQLHTQCRKVQPHFPYEEITAMEPVVLQLEGRGSQRRLREIWDARAAA